MTKKQKKDAIPNHHNIYFIFNIDGHRAFRNVGKI